MNSNMNSNLFHNILSIVLGVLEPPISADVCRAWLPATWSRRDTPETPIETQANNAGRSSDCGVK